MPDAERGTVVIHDYSGHPGQAQLSRALARRGYVVVHQHCADYVTGKGSVRRAADDPTGISFEAVGDDSGGAVDRYSAPARLRHEIAYSRVAARAITAHRPQVVVLSNVPLLAHALLARRLRRDRIPMVFWHQDIYSAALGARARQKLPVVGGAAAWAADRIEGAVARSSAAVVAISDTFLDKLGQWGVAGRTTVVPNWGPIDEITPVERDNPWREAQGLGSCPVVLYSGTLGLKHDPSILSTVAEHLAATVPEARVVVVSEGLGRQWLERWRADAGATNLLLLDYQPYDQLPAVLGTGDVLVAILEPDASKYSVPSKVLTYLCAGRAVMGVLPRDNSVARILLDNEAGVVVEPAERTAVARQVQALLEDADLRRRLGAAARGYAEEAFSPDRAAEVFERIIVSITSAPG